MLVAELIAGAILSVECRSSFDCAQDLLPAAKNG